MRSWPRAASLVALATAFIASLLLVKKKRKVMGERKDDKKERICSAENPSGQQDEATRRKEFQERLAELEKVENPKETRKRYERYNAFEKFHEIVKENFISFRDADKRGRFYEAFNMLCVCPGSRAGMNRRDTVEVFWGSKVYDSVYKESRSNHFKLETETGATLLFLRKDDGYVTVYLLPAHTEKVEGLGEIIIRNKSLHPARLKLKRVLRRMWRDFMAFTEVTHLDGHPTLYQKSRIYWLRFTRQTLRDDKLYIRRYLTVLYQILKWVFTVGLSGAILAGVQMYRDSVNSDSGVIENVNKTIADMDSTQRNNSLILQQISTDVEETSEFMKNIDETIKREYKKTPAKK